MNEGQRAFGPDSNAGDPPMGFSSAAGATCLAIRVWTPSRTDVRWSSQTPLVDLISDLISASDGSLLEDPEANLLANFDLPRHAFRAAKRIQWSLLEFCQHRPELCLGAAMVISDVRDFPPGSGNNSPREVTAILAQAKPAQILATGSTHDHLQGLPGLQSKAFTALSQGSAGWRGEGRELIWTTPSNLESAQEVLKNAAQNLARKPVTPSASEPTADFGAGGGMRGAQPTLVHADLPPQPGEEPLNDLTTLEPSSERSGVLWWSLGAVGLAAAVTLAILFFRTQPKPAVVSAPSVQAPATVESAPPTDSKAGQPEPAAVPAPPVAAATKPPETPQEATPAPAATASQRPHRDAAKKVVETNGFTEKDIPRLLRRAQNDAGNGKNEEARQEFRTVLQLDPNNAEAKLGLKKLDLSE